REVAPPVTAEQLGRIGVPEDTGTLFGEDAVTRERSKHAVEGVHVRTDVTRYILDGSRAVCERVGDPEIGGDRERTRRQRAAQPVPDDRLGCDGAHRRATAIAAATSSISSAAIVRQSSSVRSLRTSATTGGSAARSRDASPGSSSTPALGRSYSGSAPPPGRASVSTTTPSVSAASRSARARTPSTGSRSLPSARTSRSPPSP